MRVICHSLLVLFLLTTSTASGGDWVRFSKKSGESITGELLEPDRDGYYRVRVGEHVVEIKHDDVYTTTEVGRDEPQPDPTPRQRSGLTVVQVIETLARRPQKSVAPDAENIYNGCTAAAIRNEWDFAIRSAERLLTREPKWADPQILRAQLLSERGDTTESVRVALFLERGFPRDHLAQRVAAECFRRASYPLRHAQVLSRVIDAESPGLRGGYEKIALWWKADPQKAVSLWLEYQDSDPTWSKPWCREGNLRRRAEMALAGSHWRQARLAVDELRRQHPWTEGSLQPLEIEILANRLEYAQASGQHEGALLALDSLEMRDPAHASEWHARRKAVQTFFLERGLMIRAIAEFESWCAQTGHLFMADAEARRRISQKFQAIASVAFAGGRIQDSQRAFMSAGSWDAKARPENGDWWGPCRERLREDLRLRRSLRLLHGVEVLRDAYPDRSTQLENDVADLYREELVGVPAEELHRKLAELHAVFARQVRPSLTAGRYPTPADTDDMPGKENLRLAALAYPHLARYFPHEVGTRWVYATGKGERETREVIAVTPESDGTWKITLRVSESDAPGYDYDVWLVGGDLLNGFAKSPPGEIALRYPLTDGSEWSWSKGSLMFERQLRRPEQPLSLALGSFDDHIVIEAVNSIRASESKSYRTWKRIFYVSDVGIVKIESEDPGAARTLIEFHVPANK